jgi:bifunctional DNA-binding transcriptional regulator/antitoxin component of YhaV-PrlF toxin-antitoxin module
MTATVQPDGALVLPREACERLGLKAGQILEVQTEGDLLVAWKKSATNPFENWRGRGRLLSVPSWSSADSAGLKSGSGGVFFAASSSA